MATKTTYSIILTMGYTATDFTRKYKFTNVDAAALAQVKNKVIAYNNNIPEQDKKIFISDDYDDENPNDVIGALKGIVAAQYESVTETPVV